MGLAAAADVAAVLAPGEQLIDLGMGDRLLRIIRHQVLLRHVGDVGCFRVLRQQVVERLVLARADVLRDGKPPFLGVGKLWIDVEDHAAEWEKAVADNFADAELGIFDRHFHHCSPDLKVDSQGGDVQAPAALSTAP
ncbi:conserved hypothetical protein [Candidatus Defluviicoccus seviourii]|uniref:Uncharacterized protein n=1 Tax=Candidatus Defluviicoccus seviourii TaxID=2565273 RepID=A0A564WHW5_9PROT|nr:conserved hypothetical protein [Candidatus Defluviicoccus seviourii]